MTNSANFPNWCQLAELAANWLAARHAVCHRTNDPMASSPIGGQLVKLVATGQKLAGNWLNWGDDAYGVCHRTNDPMANWQPISPVGDQLANWLELDGPPGRPLAGKSTGAGGNIHASADGRRRGPWGISWVAGFIGDADLSVLTEQKNTTPQQQQRPAHAL